MAKINVADITLRECGKSPRLSLSFKDKIEIIKLLDKLHCNIIELPEITNETSDELLFKTAASLANHAEICVNVGKNAEKIQSIYECIKNAKRRSLKVSLPVSTVQMEYLCSKKPAMMLQFIEELVSECKKHCDNVEFSAEDAFRADRQFLHSAVETAIKSGATRINICDSEGTSLPYESESFIRDVIANVKNISDVTVSVEFKNQFNMSVSSSVAAILSGAECVRVSVEDYGYPVFDDLINFFRLKGDVLNISTSLKTTESQKLLEQIKNIIHPAKSEGFVSRDTDSSRISLDKNDDFSTVMKEVSNLGYELSPEDQSNVYEAFKRVAYKKDQVGKKELEAIIATSALQVPETYSIDSYVINCGNTFNATASIKLIKDGKSINGISTGDGPIAASFVAIDQIVGCHYELDDFQIRAVTEGHEAMGSAIVRLRSSDGKLYSGHGISTDIVGASIRAYVSALNKIAYEEG